MLDLFQADQDSRLNMTMTIRGNARNNRCNHLDNTKIHNKVVQRFCDLRHKVVNQMIQVLSDLQPSSHSNTHQTQYCNQGMKFVFQHILGGGYLHRAMLNLRETNLTK